MRIRVPQFRGHAVLQTCGISCLAVGIGLWSIAAALVLVGGVLTALGVAREAKGRG